MALFTIISAYAWGDFVFDRSRGTVFDPTRIAAQIVTGIGFLGAGAIIRQGLSIRGLTTAAGLWVVAAIGMAAGAGYWPAALLGTGVVLVGLGPLRFAEGWIVKSRSEGGSIEIDLRPDEPLAPLLAVLEGKRARVHRIQLEEGNDMIADEYVAIAEKMGVMHKLDFIQLEKALQEVADSGYAGYLFLNLSPKALVLNDFVQETRRIVSKFDIAHDRLVFEITERETIKNMALMDRFITTLRNEGFKLAIDDFGSGFSSFHYVKRFPIDFLKIEGDFILGMKNSDKDRALVRSIVSLAIDLGIRTVAEYVEDEAVLDEVFAHHIDLAQGYHIQRPSISLARVMQVSTRVRESGEDGAA